MAELRVVVWLYWQVHVMLHNADSEHRSRYQWTGKSIQYSERIANDTQLHASSATNDYKSSREHVK